MDIIERKLRDIHLLLKLVYGIVPIVAGLDKFTNLLTAWPEYLNPTIAGILPVSATTFMMIVGVIEILAGILVLIKPKGGAMLVGSWLVLIALTLIASGRFLDVAVRDVVMAAGAFAFARLSVLVESFDARRSNAKANPTGYAATVKH